MTVLFGGTNTPPEGARVANAGEFAAVWNTATLAQREDYVKRMGEANDTALNCIVQDHDSLKEQAERARFLQEVEINRLAQYFYEEVGRVQGVKVVMNMTDKGNLVEALSLALARIGRVKTE